MVTETLVSAILQVGLVVVLAWAVYWFAARKRMRFPAFIGMTRAPPRVLLAGVVAGLGFCAGVLSVPALRALATSTGSVAGGVVSSGAAPASVVAALVVAAVFKTSLAEELLFRGLIGKRLIAWRGFAVGNTVQAVLFGLVHLLLLLLPGVATALVLAMVAATGVLGWFNGWLNERHGKGSILPGWAAHGTANLLSYLSVIYLGTASPG